MLQGCNGGGCNAADVTQDVPPQHCKDSIISFYKTKVVTTTVQAKQLQLLILQHQYDEMTCGIWKAESRIASSIGLSLICSKFYLLFFPEFPKIFSYYSFFFLFLYLAYYSIVMLT